MSITKLRKIQRDSSIKKHLTNIDFYNGRSPPVPNVFPKVLCSKALQTQSLDTKTEATNNSIQNSITQNRTLERNFLSFDGKRENHFSNRTIFIKKNKVFSKEKNNDKYLNSLLPPPCFLKKSPSLNKSSKIFKCNNIIYDGDKIIQMMRVSKDRKKKEKPLSFFNLALNNKNKINQHKELSASKPEQKLNLKINLRIPKKKKSKIVFSNEFLQTIKFF